MPQIAEVRSYFVEQRGSQWCVVDSTRTKTLGCHDTKAEAEAQLRAIEANKGGYSQLYELRNVEVFAEGTWNGDPYTAKDLDQMVAAAKTVGFTPPLKDGHAERSGAPSLGWIENLRRIGTKLVADLTHLPQAVYEAIRNRRYDRVSAEVYWDYEQNGTTLPRVLKAVALLGAEIPAVPELQPLHEVVHTGGGQVRAYDTHLEELTMMALAEVVEFTREQIKEICPACAAKMKQLNFKSVKIPVITKDGVREFQMAAIPPAMLEGLCSKYAPGEGFRTRCMENPPQGEGFNPEDVGALCNALKGACLDAGHISGELNAEDDQPEKHHARSPAADKSAKEAPMDEAQVKALEVTLEEKISKKYETSITERDARISKLETEQRESAVKAKLAEFTLPRHREALAPIVRALMTPTPVEHTYSKDGKDVKVLAVDLLRDECNRLVPKEFAAKELATGSHVRAEGPEITDPRGEADKRAKAFMAEKGQKDYSIALHAVLDADADLKKAYARA